MSLIRGPNTATVLLVDDDPLARRVLELHFGKEPTLKGLGARIVHAADGQKALETAAAEKPDLVVVDLLMPRLDGFGFCRELRKTDHGKNMPLLVVSGVYRDPALTSKLLDEVKGRFLPKPVAGRDFADAVTALLGVTAAPAVDLASAGEFDAAEGDAAPKMRPEDVDPNPAGEHRTTREFGSGTTRADPVRTIQLAGVARPSGDVRVSRSMTVAAPEHTAELAKKLQASATGSLAEVGLPRLLFDHLEAGSTGTLALRRGRMRKEIFIAGGKPVGADSNLRQEAFGVYLVDHKVIDDATLRTALSAARRQRKKLGAVLVDMRAITEEDAVRHLEGQARARIAASLRWHDGEWSFVPGDGFGGSTLPHAIDAERTVLAGLRRGAGPETAAALLGRHGSSRAKLSKRGERFRAQFESVFGAETLSAVLAAPHLSALEERPDAEVLLSGAEALIATGMVGLGPAAEPPGPPAPAEPFSLRRLKALAAAGAAPGGFRISLDRPDDSGVVDLGPPAVAAARAEKRRALLHEALEVHDRSYYDLLGVPANATDDVIRQAHGVAAARWGADAFADVDLGLDAGKLTEVRAIYARTLEVLSDPERRREYDRRLAKRHEIQSAFDAELAFRDGLDALAAGRAGEAAAAFATAADAEPDQAAHHAYLGWARFAADRKDTARARAALDEALALDPDLVEGHDFLGRMAAEAGEAAEAQEHLEKTLLLDPTRAAAFDTLAALYASAGRIPDLERLHRKLLHRLVDREPELRLRLWRQLGDLYLRTLGDRPSAEIAFQAAAALAPDDSGVRSRVLEMGADDPRAWREAARALAAEWRARPVDTQPGHSLMEVLAGAGRHDGAFMAACALALRGLANPEVTAYIDRHRPRELPRIVAPFDAGMYARVRHPDEDDDIEELMGLLAGHGVIPPFSFDELGLDESTAVPPDSQPETFARVLLYVAAVLGIEPPVVHVRTDLDRDARMADLRPYALVVGGALLATDDRLELAFRFGRALGFGSAGRVAGASRPGRLMRGPLRAALTLAGRPTDEDGDTSPLAESRVEAVAEPARGRIRELGERLLSERKTVNLSAWTRALDRTACRIGLILSGDLLRVGDVVGDEEGPEAVEDLVDFAVSPECGEIRDQLTGRTDG